MKRLLMSLAVTGATALSSCGHDPSQGWVTGTPYTHESRTIAIPIVKNSTYDREMGYLLTNALIREVETRTPWRVVSSAEADTLLEVSINSVDLNTLSNSRLTKLNQESVVRLRCDWTWEDLNDNRVLAGWENFTTDGLFLPSNPLYEPIELGQLTAVDLMAKAIVDRMSTSW